MTEIEAWLYQVRNALAFGVMAAEEVLQSHPDMVELRQARATLSEMLHSAQEMDPAEVEAVLGEKAAPASGAAYFFGKR